MRWGQLLPTGEKFCCHTIQEHRPIKANMAVHSGEPLCHPATARIAMGAHQHSTPRMASQQLMATEPLHRHQAIPELHQAMQEQGGCHGISDQRRRQRSAPSNQGNKPSTSKQPPTSRDVR